ncbi:MAG: type II toxin-antitoxin system VapC family toxin [Desulfatiglans sp.]|jgi:tRNA(fMet)-specific endonuclease VapC|nr:type II toxin-antitoxin system VapC family toxin [Desulfatiglans sp.]
MKILLDTSAYVAFKLNNEEIVEVITNSDEIVFSPIVMGELLYGFRNGAKFKQNMDELNQFLSHEIVEILKIGDITSDRYSRIAQQLKSNGTPIPTNDIWIAAQAMEHGAELITCDNHFNRIAGLVHTIF